MSLYDDLDGVPLQSSSEEAGKLSGWSNSIKLMQAQLQRKKVVQNKPVFPSPKSKLSAAVVLGKGSLNKRSVLEEKELEFDLARDNAETIIGQSVSQTFPDPFSENELPPVVMDEYDPMKPNDYEIVKEQMRELKERERRDQRDRDRDARMRERYQEIDQPDRHRDRDRDRDRERPRERRRRRDDDDDDDRRHSSSRRSAGSGAAIAPPSSLVEVPPVVPKEEQADPFIDGKPLLFPGLSKKKPDVGFSASAVASNIMAKYGWKDGQGLGKSEQGINQCLQVEKTSKRGGKIINQEKEVAKPQAESSESIVDVMKNPSKVILLRNMVGPGEVDEDLQPEVAEECTKYGDVAKVIIYEIPEGAADDEAVRIFVEFQRMESAIKAVIDLNGRFFGGRTVKGGFYNLDRFRRLDLANGN